MEFSYSAILNRIKNLEKPEKVAPVIGALTATGLVIYGIKKLLGKKVIEGYEAIPTPDGAVYYLGHIPKMGDMPAHKITEWHRELGPIIRVRMGVQQWVFISDPNIAHDIFVSQGSLTSGRPYLTFGNGISGEGGRGIVFADYGKMWKNARNAVLNILSPKSVAGFDDLLQFEAQRSVDQLVDQTKTHGSVNPLPFVRVSSLNVILALAFGIPAVESPEDPFFKKMVYIIEKGIFYTSVIGDYSAYFPILSFLDVIFRKEAKMKDYYYNVGYPFYCDLLKAARASDKDNLVKKIDLIKDEYDIDERNILVILSEVLAAGGDTVSISTSWTYAILCHHPEVQRKLAEELDSFISKHHRIPTFEDRLELPYYIAVQKECMRFRPAVYFSVPRKANEDVLYKNYVIPKGTIMVSNIHTLQTNEELYPNPDEFIPERYLGDTRTMYASGNGKIQDRDHFNFGWGRRICPGIAMAEHELFNVITRMMARCTIEPDLGPNGEKIYPDLDDFKDGGATLQPSPFKLRFVERESRLIV